MATIDAVKANLFSTPMPDMPPMLHEIWRVAFMYRRKYSDPTNVDVDKYFAQAWSDAQFIVQSYGNSETVQALMLEVYLDIERQWKAHQNRLDDARA